MNVAQLIDMLEQCDLNATVMLATQPSWPLQAYVLGVHVADDGKVYVVEGGHPQDQPYAPRAAWDEVMM